MRPATSVVASAIVVVAILTACTGGTPRTQPWRAPHVGIAPGAGFVGMRDAARLADLDRMAAAGVEWIRLDVDWSDIEAVRGAPDWSVADRVIAEVRQRGLRILAMIAYTPTWARPAHTSDKHPPTHPGDLARFAGAVAARFADQVDAWEIWNEPNLATFWRPRPDPAAYADLVERVTPALRDADPTATIVTAGLAPAADDDPAVEMAPETFLRDMYETLPRRTVDAIGIHPYSYPAVPSDDADWNPFTRLARMHDLVAEAEGRPLPLWLTEFGAPYDPDDPARQARIVTGGLTCATLWRQLGPIFLFAMRDLPNSGTDLRFGMLGRDGSPRRVWRDVTTLLERPVGRPTTSACEALEEPGA